MGFERSSVWDASTAGKWSVAQVVKDYQSNKTGKTVIEQDGCSK